MLTDVTVTSIDNDSITVAFEGSSFQSFENVADYPFEVGQSVQVEKRDTFDLVRAVYVDGVPVVEIPDAFISLRAEQRRIEYKLKTYRSYLKLKPGLRDRLEALHPRLRERMERFINEEGEETFFVEGMGEYELFIVEQANMLYETFKNPDVREAVWRAGAMIPINPEAPSYDWVSGSMWWDINNPAHALLAWWALNSKVHDYNYELQYDLVPGWSNGHSGNTAGAAYSFAKSLLEEEENEKVSY